MKIKVETLYNSKSSRYTWLENLSTGLTLLDTSRLRIHCQSKQRVIAVKKNHYLSHQSEATLQHIKPAKVHLKRPRSISEVWLKLRLLCSSFKLLSHKFSYIFSFFWSFTCLIVLSLIVLCSRSDVHQHVQSLSSTATASICWTSRNHYRWYGSRRLSNTRKTDNISVMTVGEAQYSWCFSFFC